MLETVSLYVVEKLNKYVYTVISYALLLRKGVLKSHQTFRWSVLQKYLTTES